MFISCINPFLFVHIMGDWTNVRTGFHKVVLNFLWKCNEGNMCFWQQKWPAFTNHNSSKPWCHLIHHQRHTPCIQIDQFNAAHLFVMTRWQLDQFNMVIRQQCISYSLQANALLINQSQGSNYVTTSSHNGAGILLIQIDLSLHLRSTNFFHYLHEI